MKLSLTNCALALGLGLALAGCARPEQVLPPPHLLSKEEITRLLIELHLLESRIESSRLAPDSARALFLSQQREILWQHNLTEEDSTFQRSYRYYATHNKDLDEIYATIIDSLTARQRHMGGAVFDNEHH